MEQLYIETLTTAPRHTIYDQSGSTFTKAADLTDGASMWGVYSPGDTYLFRGSGILYYRDSGVWNQVDTESFVVGERAEWDSLGRVLVSSVLATNRISVLKLTSTFTANAGLFPGTNGQVLGYVQWDGANINHVLMYNTVSNQFLRYLYNHAAASANTAFSQADTLSDVIVFPGTVLDVAFSFDGTYAIMLLDTYPRLFVFKRQLDGTFAQIATPSVLPPSSSVSARFSRNGQFYVVSSTSSPYITIYERSGDVFTKLSDPATLPTGQAGFVDFNYDSTYLAVPHDVSPFVTIYSISGSTFTKIADPAVLPDARGLSAYFSRNQTGTVIAGTITDRDSSPADATVRAYLRSSGVLQASATTDAGGAFNLSALTAAEHDLVATDNSGVENAALIERVTPTALA